jgi:type II secretory pathway component PulF
MYSLIELINAPLEATIFVRMHTVRRATLLKTMAQAVERGLPLVPFLAALADEAGGVWSHRLRLLSDSLDAGTAIPLALESVPRLLPAEILGIIRVAAQSGRLAAALNECAAALSSDFEQSRAMNVLGLFTYLAMVGPVFLGCLGFVSYWIIPKFRFIFAGFGLELPPLTQSLIDASAWFADYWFVLPLMLLALILLGMIEAIVGLPATINPLWLMKSRHPRRMMPAVLRALSFAVEGRRPLNSSLATMATCSKDLAGKQCLAMAASAVSAGANCWSILHSLKIVHAGELALLAAGERVGNLPWVLRCLAEVAERRRSHRTRVLYEVLRPLLILLIGIVVGWFVLALFMPIVKMIEVLA